MIFRWRTFKTTASLLIGLCLPASALAGASSLVIVEKDQIRIKTENRKPEVCSPMLGHSHFEKKKTAFVEVCLEGNRTFSATVYNFIKDRDWYATLSEEHREIVAKRLRRIEVIDLSKLPGKPNSGPLTAQLPIHLIQISADLVGHENYRGRNSRGSPDCPRSPSQSRWVASKLEIKECEGDLKESTICKHMRNSWRSITRGFKPAELPTAARYCGRMITSTAVELPQWFFPNGQPTLGEQPSTEPTQGEGEEEIEGYKSRGRYRDGKKIGEWISKDENGKVRRRCSYIDNNLNGQCETYSENGVTLTRGAYINGKKTGPWETKNDRGITTERVTWIDDQKSGSYEKFRDDGSPESRGMYDRDKKSGIWETLNEKSILTEKSTWFDDQKTGPYEKYRDDGSLAFQGRYTQDRRSGTWEERSEKGILIEKSTWENNRRNGPFESYDSEGVLTAKGSYIANQKTGIWNSYYKDYETGKACLSARTTYANDVEEGLQENYDCPYGVSRMYSSGYNSGGLQKGTWYNYDYTQNGTRYAYAIYHYDSNGQMDGDQQFLDQTGNQYAREIYVHGTFIRYENPRWEALMNLLRSQGKLDY